MNTNTTRARKKVKTAKERRGKKTEKKKKEKGRFPTIHPGDYLETERRTHLAQIVDGPLRLVVFGQTSKRKYQVTKHKNQEAHSIYRCIHLSIDLSLSLSIYQSIYLSIYLYRSAIYFSLYLPPPPSAHYLLFPKGLTCWQP